MSSGWSAAKTKKSLSRVWIPRRFRNSVTFVLACEMPACGASGDSRRQTITGIGSLRPAFDFSISLRMAAEMRNDLISGRCGLPAMTLYPAGFRGAWIAVFERVQNNRKHVVRCVLAEDAIDVAIGGDHVPGVQFLAVRLAQQVVCDLGA